MFNQHDFIIWGTYCKCGHECSILQNEHHPWDESSEYEKYGFAVELEFLDWYKSGYFINAYKK